MNRTTALLEATCLESLSTEFEQDVDVIELDASVRGKVQVHREVGMKKRMRQIRGAVRMGLTWAVGWGLVGALIELIQEFVPGWNGALVDIFPVALAVPAFLGGVVFSGVLSIAGGRRRFGEMSLPRFARWGALGGLLVSVPIMILSGFSPPSLFVAGTVTLLCTGSAAGSLALARRAEDRQLLDAVTDVAEVGLAGGETQKRLGGTG